MEGVYVADQLLDGIHQAGHSACGEEEGHQEEVQAEQDLPVISAQRPAEHTQCLAFLVLSKTAT